MKNLLQRVADLEGRQTKADLTTMTDDELDSYIATLEAGSPAFYQAVVANLMRHPSPFPIVVDDLDDFIGAS